ncbi:FixH family protein [bacterium]|nr:FixH family protein [bacterium]MBU1993205.1 FixH family protein [bacterium]
MSEGKKMKKSSGRIWPYAIGASIVLVFGACVATIIVANTLPVEPSDTYMMNYHDADAQANELIESKIAFDKNYKISYITDGLSREKSVIKYKVTDSGSNTVNNAQIKVVITRPNNHKYDKELVNPTIQDGIYTFESVTLPIDGRWDVMAKVNIGEFNRFYNVKADTRAKEAFEY